MTWRGDDGQAAMPVILFLGILVLAAVVVAVVPVGAATNERSRAQTAADAAALAGAEYVRTAWVYTFTAPGVLTFPAGPLPGSVNASSGSGSASSYSHANGSRVTSYRLYPASGRAQVEVQSRDAAYPDNGRAEAAATAEMDADFATCTWDDPVPPSPLPTGPLVFVRTLECGAWSATYTIANVNSGAIYPTVSYFGDTPTGLFADLEPRLVS